MIREVRFPAYKVRISSLPVEKIAMEYKYPGEELVEVFESCNSYEYIARFRKLDAPKEETPLRHS
jgi:hypothetical protein